MNKTRLRSLTEKQMRIKASRFNRSGFAITEDDKMPLKPTTQRPRLKGTSRWKKWTPEAIQRAAGARAPARVTVKGMHSKRAGARTHSHMSVIHSKSLCAKAIMDGQAAGLNELWSWSLQEPFEFYITNHVFDESKLWYKVEQKGYPQVTAGGFRHFSTLAGHSQVTWKDATGVHDEHVIRTPQALAKYNARTQWNALTQDPMAGILPEAGLRPLARFNGTLTICDSHMVNKLMLKHLRAVLPTDHLLLPTWCLQHAVGTTCTRVTDYLNLFNRVWVLAKTFSEGDFHIDLVKHMRQVLADEEEGLEVVDPESFVAEPGDLNEDFSDALMERCYVNSRHQEDLDNPGAVKHRKTVKNEFCKFFPKGWNRARVLHLCPPNCCGPSACHDRNVSVERAASLIENVILKKIINPAKNKWTKMDPAMCQATLVHCFFKLIKMCLEAKCKVSYEHIQASDTQEEQNVEDMAQGDQENFKGMQLRYGKRCLAFVGEENCRNYLLLWSMVGQVIVTMHYSFFKHVSWFSDRKRNIPRLSVPDFCPDLFGQVSDNVASRALDDLAALMFEPDGERSRHVMQPLYLVFGETARWPTRLMHAFQKCTHLAFCLIWRHLIHRFLCYPWAAAAIFNPEIPPYEKHDAIVELCSSQPCCIDSGLCQPLREELCSKEDDFLHPGLQEFVWTMLQRAMPTSTAVEMMFAPLSMWTEKSRARLTLSGLDALHVNTVFEDTVEKWWQQLESHVPGCVTSGNQRDPVMAHSEQKGIHTCAWHQFTKGKPWGENKDLRAQFKDLPECEKQEYKRRAKNSRVQARIEGSACDKVLAHMAQDLERCGPWKLSAKCGTSRADWPLHPSIIQKEDNLKTADTAWRRDTNMVSQSEGTWWVGE